MSRGRGKRNWNDWLEEHPIPHKIKSRNNNKVRSQFSIRDMGAGSYEVTNSTDYWWHIMQEADGTMSIIETDCKLPTLNAYALRAVKKLPG